ncbi:MAG: hypothetical protein HUU20_17455 [Pirellulales bacterium]|nr:hypothetical protein [Pirellulales bacterium]
MSSLCVRRMPLWITLAVAAAVVGCRPVEVFRRGVDDVTPPREQRKAELVAQFEQRRDLAEMLAAEEQRHRGDLAGCDAALHRLLQRNPDHFEAKLLQAELRLEQGRGREVLPDLYPLAEARPTDARLQYTIGLLLDACGDTQAAIAYYAKAAELEPGNELYARSHLSVTQPAVSLASGVSEHTTPPRR